MQQNKIQTTKSDNDLSKSLDRALKQVKERKISPHVAVRKKYAKWLKD